MGQGQGLKMNVSHLALDSSKSRVLVNVSGSLVRLRTAEYWSLFCFSTQTDMQSMGRKGFALIPWPREVGREGMIFI